MHKKKLQFKEDNKTIEKDNDIRNIIKARINNHFDKNDSLENSQNEEEIINPIRGRQPNNNIFTINKNIINQNNPSAINSECKKREDINKKEITRKKIKANSARLKDYDNKSESNNKIEDQYFSVDSASENSDQLNRNLKKTYKEKYYLKTEYTKKVKNFQTSDTKFIFDESKETDYNMQDDESSGGLLYQLEDNSDTLEKMENLNIEIERILIDVYNNHIKSDKKVSSLDITKYERHITNISMNLDKYNNLIILQIFEEKIKDLIERYKEKIFEIPDISIIKNKFSEIKKNLNTQNKKYSEKLLICRQQTSVELNDQIKQVMDTLLLELRNIKLALINSSADLSIIFKSPLDFLNADDKKEIFSIEDMHKEEFHNTLIEDEFISCLLHHIKNVATDYKIEEIIKLIDYLENDSHNYSMSNFCFYIDELMKEILEKGNNCEIQIQNLKPNNLTITNTNCNYKGVSQANNNVKNKTIENLDDLVAYINSNDKPTKKGKKKNLKKKNAINKQITKSNNNNSVLEDETIIENFRKNIYSNSRFAGSTRKIKPVFSHDWIDWLKS